MVLGEARRKTSMRAINGTTRDKVITSKSDSERTELLSDLGKGMNWWM